MVVGFHSSLVHVSCLATCDFWRRQIPENTTPTEMSGDEADAAGAVTQARFAQLIEAISSSEARMTERFAKFQAEVRQGQEDVPAKALKKAKYDKPYAFKRKGNEEQAKFNAHIDESLAEVDDELAAASASTTAPPALDRAKEALKKGRSIIAERQKLIRLADRSEYGWNVVDEYLADDLASGSDDEKRIEKAEKAAERKAGKRRKNKRPTEPTASRAGGARAPARFIPQPQPVQGSSASMGAAQVHYHAPGRQAAVLPGPRGVIGPCFSCGGYGHLRASCPKPTLEHRKWYPFVTSVAAVAAPSGELPIQTLSVGPSTVGVAVRP